MLKHLLVVISSSNRLAPNAKPQHKPTTTSRETDFILRYEHCVFCESLSIVSRWYVCVNCSSGISPQPNILFIVQSKTMENKMLTLVVETNVLYIMH